MVRTARIVPKEWTKYTPMGTVINRTRFLVFKTPLNDQLLNRVPKEHRFNVTGMFRMLAERDQRLGIVVDLTDTDRYYDKNDIEGMCVEYEKINCPGRGFIDNDDYVDAFNSVIQKYIDRCEDPEALIGVHCTHGVNRSGYLICRFLIEHLGWSSHEALEAFETARGYPIANGSYVQSLHKAAIKLRERQSKVESGSDSDSEERRKKRNKKSKKKREYEGDERTRGVDDIMKQFLKMEKEAQEAAESASGYGSPSMLNFDSPQQHWGFPAAKRRKVRAEQSEPADTAEEPEEEPIEDSQDAEMEGVDDGEEDSNQPMSAAAKRRLRKNRVKTMLNVMKRGNFHEIQEAQEEFLRSKGANL